MRAIGAIVGTTSILAAVGGEFLSTVTAVSLGVTFVLALLLFVLAIGSWDELDAANENLAETRRSGSKEAIGRL